ncbi:MAG: hypothetical protein LAP39_22915 [Acidobacteriia bacterium]|nr:hypothetical protein [Terriglobia bacterium]
MGLVVIAIAVAWILYMQRGSHIEPTGKILKVRTLAADENASIAVIDFRVENASNFGIIVREVTVTLEEPNGKTDEGSAVSEVDAQRLFQYYPILGQKFNDTLKLRDRIKAHETMDRMIAVRFEIPQAQVDARKNLRLRVEDVDGPFGELVERK